MSIRRDFQKNKLFNRRALVIGGIKSSLIFALFARLSYLQIFKHKEYSIQSDSNSIKPLITPAPRGLVFDRSGVVIARNDDDYRLLLFLDNKNDNLALVKKLAEILDLDNQTVDLFLAKIKNAKRRSIICLLDNLSWSDLAKVEVNSYRLPSVTIEKGNIRRYPFPFETAHFLGYVSLPSESEIDNNDQKLFMHPDFRIGKNGIEKSFDEVLRGKYGVKYVEVDVLNNPVRTLSSRQMVDGSKLHLTIDIALQKYVTSRLKDDVASSVVIDIKTGEILAYASSPSFNSNNFVEGVSRKYWDELYQDERVPLNNRPISALYPPGSTFKAMTALAALENGFDHKKKFTCNGHFQYGKRVFHCWKPGGHGTIDIVDAIKYSCNVFFYNVGDLIGIEKIAPMASKFGYGQRFDISLYGVKSGNVPDPDWKQKIYKQPWVGGDNLNTAIGQGFLLASPLQMALVTARLANGGIPIKPYLVKNHNIHTQYNELSSQKLVKPANLKLVLEGMRRVVNEPDGTSYASRINIKGFEMAGKTGTSQVISKRASEMTKYQSSITKIQNHGIFIGLAPVDNPKYAVAVVVEHGKSGAGSAAPIGRDILIETQKLGGVT